MTVPRCTAPARGHVPGSQAQRQCPVHGGRTGASSLPAPAAPSTPAPEPASEHKQRVRPDGTVVEEWYRNDELHREDGPAWVARSPDGTVIEEWWYKNGRLHREDGPAHVVRSPDGTVIEGWYRNGITHREDGPAGVVRSPDGTVVEEWYKNDELHREDGPAWAKRRPDGTVTEDWYLDDTEVGAWQVLGRYLTTRGMPELSTEALKQIAKDVPWQRWDELGPDHPLVRLWATMHPSADARAG